MQVYSYLIKSKYITRQYTGQQTPWRKLQLASPILSQFTPLRSLPVIAALYFGGDIRYLSLFVIIFVSACSIVDVQEYVHEPTNSIRHSVVYSSHTKIEGMNGEDFKIIPNFRMFAPSYSFKRGALIFAANKEMSVNVIGAKIMNMDTGESSTIDINREISIDKPIPKDKYFIGFLVVIDEEFSHSEKYSGAQELNLEVFYKNASGEIVTEIFVLNLITRKDVAWVT